MDLTFIDCEPDRKGSDVSIAKGGMCFLKTAF